MRKRTHASKVICRGRGDAGAAALTFVVFSAQVGEKGTRPLAPDKAEADASDEIHPDTVEAGGEVALQDEGGLRKEDAERGAGRPLRR